ncbi:hypothetical protein [Bacillus cereus]|uniref:hypothetical protein n=1 Tax=Bacillus cereus TaxID=1396 RepID=UPI000B4BA19F|nr:hypothetical protein [Bacillus cereus]
MIFSYCIGIYLLIGLLIMIISVIIERITVGIWNFDFGGGFCPNFIAIPFILILWLPLIYKNGMEKWDSLKEKRRNKKESK